MKVWTEKVQGLLRNISLCSWNFRVYRRNRKGEWGGVGGGDGWEGK